MNFQVANFSQVATPALYAKVRDNVESELQGIKYYSATADLWSSKGLLPYISYTIHWLDDEWNYNTRCLETFVTGPAKTDQVSTKSKICFIA